MQATKARPGIELKGVSMMELEWTVTGVAKVVPGLKDREEAESLPAIFQARTAEVPWLVGWGSGRSEEAEPSQQIS